MILLDVDCVCMILIGFAGCWCISLVQFEEPCMHRFTYVTTPHADYVTPRAGPIDGGTNVTVHGRYSRGEHMS